MLFVHSHPSRLYYRQRRIALSFGAKWWTSNNYFDFFVRPLLYRNFSHRWHREWKVWISSFRWNPSSFIIVVYATGQRSESFISWRERTNVRAKRIFYLTKKLVCANRRSNVLEFRRTNYRKVGSYSTNLFYSTCLTSHVGNYFWIKQTIWKHKKTSSLI